MFTPKLLRDIVFYIRIASCLLDVTNVFIESTSLYDFDGHPTNLIYVLLRARMTTL